MKKRNLTDDERHRVVCLLFESCKNGKPAHGKMNEVASMFNVTRKSIFSIWTAAKQQRVHEVPINVRSKIKGKKGKERIPCPLEAIMALDVSKRTTLKRLGKAIGHASSTYHRWVKQGLIKSHTRSIHPALSEDHKHIRLHFVMGKLVFDRLLRCVMFKDMGTIIHIDEKWFYMTNPKCRYYIGSNEALPYRSCKSKRYITKIMFLAAVSSQHTKKMEKFCLMERLVYGHLLTKNQQKEKVRIGKLDNAKPHISGKDKDFMEAANSDGLTSTKTVEQLVQNVTEAYEAETVETLDNVFLSLQSCMVEIMQKRGHNNYPLPHLAKAAQRRQGTLPRDLTVNEDLICDSNSCVNCEQATETHEHLFGSCVYSSQIIDGVEQWLCRRISGSNLNCTKLHKRVARMALMATWYCIWKYRNECRLSLTLATPRRVIKEIQSIVKARILQKIQTVMPQKDKEWLLSLDIHV
ncbi:uncharacterized protein LOC141629624 [Silene latifolia]|uniref:uncharacterized protein LOC141629624 n=1 Tax=Silene latifolia TaxID=37657 RepID=UPI003D7872AB